MLAQATSDGYRVTPDIEQSKEPTRHSIQEINATSLTDFAWACSLGFNGTDVYAMPC